jgi:hypothetical protein
LGRAIIYSSMYALASDFLDPVKTMLTTGRPAGPNVVTELPAGGSHSYEQLAAAMNGFAPWQHRQATQLRMHLQEGAGRCMEVVI